LVFTYCQGESSNGIRKSRGGCKIALPGKIDDFAVICERQQSCHGSFDEVDPSGAIKENEHKWPQKGDFNGQMSFVSCFVGII